MTNEQKELLDSLTLKDIKEYLTSYNIEMLEKYFLEHTSVGTFSEANFECAPMQHSPRPPYPDEMSGYYDELE